MVYFRLLALFLTLTLLTGRASASELSFPKIKSLYEEGELEKIRVSLESFLKNANSNISAKERIFAYKYLGVIYAADPQGRPVAETYFYQMLKLAPGAHLSDLYVSSSVERVFTETRDRFQRESRENTEFDEFGNPRHPAKTPEPMPVVKNDPVHPITVVTPGRGSPKDPQIKSKTLIWPWVVGVGIAAAVGGYFWLNNQPRGHNTTLEAP